MYKGSQQRNKEMPTPQYLMQNGKHLRNHVEGNTLTYEILLVDKVYGVSYYGAESGFVKLIWDYSN